MNKWKKPLGIIAGIGFIILLVFVVYIGLNDPQTEIKRSLETKDYQTAVHQYNNKIFGHSEKENEINECFSESIRNTFLEWSEEEIGYEDAVDKLSTLEGLNNTELSNLSSEYLHTIEVENQGSILHLQAEECFQASEYIEAMSLVSQIDKSYSQSELTDELYVQCRSILLEDLSGFETIEEYEKGISTLDRYLDTINDVEFVNRKDQLSDELDKLEEVTQIIEESQNLYAKGMYQASFDKISNGLSEYPNEKHLVAGKNDLRDDYIVHISGQVTENLVQKKYQDALEIAEGAQSIYPCDEFQELINTVNEEKKISNRIKRNAGEIFLAIQQGWNHEKLTVKQDGAGAYVLKSGKKLILGDYSDEDITVLSFSGNILSGIANLDVLFDFRDLAYDIQHWGEEEYFVLYLAADVVAILPVIGAVKYLKHADTAVDAGKNSKKLRGALNNTDTVADAVIDIAKGAENASEAVGTVSDLISKTKRSSIISKLKKEHYGYIKTINESLVGKKHPISKVRYRRVYLDYTDGRKVVGGFPVFKSIVDIQLPEELYQESFKKQKKYLSSMLNEMIQKDHKLKKQFSKEQLEEIADGVIPDGYVWHHNEKEGLMQLVDSEIHAQSKHTGGNYLWGEKYKTQMAKAE